MVALRSTTSLFFATNETVSVHFASQKIANPPTSLGSVLLYLYKSKTIYQYFPVSSFQKKKTYFITIRHAYFSYLIKQKLNIWLRKKSKN